jgi:sec-independent protein translocase protein TatA
LGGAVKGFKDGMKDGSAPADDKAAAPAAAVSADKNTIDVEVKNKS